MKKFVILLFLVFCSSCSLFKPTLSIPSNIRVENNILHWNEVDNASKYIIIINEEKYTTTTNEYDLSSLDYGEYEIKIKAKADNYNDSKFSEIINYNNFEKPQIISDNEINYNGEDIIIEFELFGGSISSVNSELISNVDYEIDNNKLIINKEFIEKELTEDKEKLIIGYTLSNKEHNVVGYIFIYK